MIVKVATPEAPALSCIVAGAKVVVRLAGSPAREKETSSAKPPMLLAVIVTVVLAPLLRDVLVGVALSEKSYGKIDAVRVAVDGALLASPL